MKLLWSSWSVESSKELLKKAIHLHPSLYSKKSDSTITHWTLTLYLVALFWCIWWVLFLCRVAFYDTIRYTLLSQVGDFVLDCKGCTYSWHDIEKQEQKTETTIQPSKSNPPIQFLCCLGFFNSLRAINVLETNSWQIVLKRLRIFVVL